MLGACAAERWEASWVVGRGVVASSSVVDVPSRSTDSCFIIQNELKPETPAVAVVLLYCKTVQAKDKGEKRKRP